MFSRIFYNSSPLSYKLLNVDAIWYKADNNIKNDNIKNMTYDNVNIHEKTRLNPFSKNIFLEKP